MPRGVPACRHWWRKIGPAPAFRGIACVLWRCDTCAREWELFEGAEPQTGRGIVAAEIGSSGGSDV